MEMRGMHEAKQKYESLLLEEEGEIKKKYYVA